MLQSHVAIISYASLRALVGGALQKIIAVFYYEVFAVSYEGKRERKEERKEEGRKSMAREVTHSNGTSLSSVITPSISTLTLVPDPS